MELKEKEDAGIIEVEWSAPSGRTKRAERTGRSENTPFWYLMKMMPEKM